MKFQEILKKKKGIFDLWLLLITLMVATYKWHAIHHLVMMHVSMKFHEILKEKGIFDVW